MMHPPSSPLHHMMYAEAAVSQATQQATQAASQDAGTELADNELWGYLIPCSADVQRIDFHRTRPVLKIGRNPSAEVRNDIILRGMKISNSHCVIEWDGKSSKESIVKVTDLSSNGTFINGEKIGKGRYGVLREGNEIAFGTPLPQPSSEDYRYIYRHTAAGPPTVGLYAHYDLISELGKGSFATVMKALSKATGQFYAVKMIGVSQLRAAATGVYDGKTGEVRREDPASGMHKEVMILQRLRHPNICALKEVFYEEAYINLVLEWVPGGDLLDYILKSDGGVPEPESKYITYQLCDALAYIHAQGIAHRDLKPENVLLTTDRPPRVKVADFGLAKVVDSLTMLRTMCGTPSYLAPEVVNQTSNQGYKQVVDSWSMGVIVFSMLTNASPFVEPDDATDVKDKILRRWIDWGCLTHAKVSKSGRHFIQRLLESDPQQRMTIEAALQHEWLADIASFAAAEAAAINARSHSHGSYSRVQDRAKTPEVEIPSNGADIDASMRSVLGAGEEIGHRPGEGARDASMVLEPPGSSQGGKIPGAFPRSQQQGNSAPPTGPAVPSSPAAPGAGGVRPLQRRRKVLEEAREKGQTTDEPTPDMIRVVMEAEAREVYGANPAHDENGTATGPSAGAGSEANGKGAAAGGGAGVGASRPKKRKAEGSPGKGPKMGLGAVDEDEPMDGCASPAASGGKGKRTSKTSGENGVGPVGSGGGEPVNGTNMPMDPPVGRVTRLGKGRGGAANGGVKPVSGGGVVDAEMGSPVAVRRSHRLGGQAQGSPVKVPRRS